MGSPSQARLNPFAPEELGVAFHQLTHYSCRTARIKLKTRINAGNLLRPLVNCVLKVTKSPPPAVYLFGLSDALIGQRAPVGARSAGSAALLT